MFGAPRVPRARGDGPSWLVFGSGVEHVFPAHAGMDRSPSAAGPTGSRVPRARGDGPYDLTGFRDAHGVFPAHAGMDRLGQSENRIMNSCSPRTRGWTDGGMTMQIMVSSVPRARGDGPAKPKTEVKEPVVFPAHAGMDRDVRRLQSVRRRVPRARGDGPLSIPRGTKPRAVFPAHAGMDRADAMSARQEIAVFPAHAGMDRCARLTHE